MDRRCFVSSVVLASVLAPLGLSASEADGPVLKIDGKIGGGEARTFRRDELEKLGLTTIRTTTPWYQGEQVFEGVDMVRLMEAVKANGTSVEVVALNKYRTIIPVSDFERHRPILALKRDGQYMAIRDKGPFFIIYPYDKDPVLRSEQYYGRSAWQVAGITVN